ncbi:MAG: CbiX/SirB N-terminal domain-containing protein, partial [Leptolyngbyaceae bacterium]|nr:CbiX/SirB N-terminal domain-containing protein [Leptolyngbyaceae bacterium]
QALGDRTTENFDRHSEHTKNGTPSSILFRVGALELGPIPLHHQLTTFGQEAAQKGIASVTILPLFLLPGTHVCDDIPAEVSHAQAELGTTIRLNLHPHLGAHPQMVNWLQHQLLQHQLLQHQFLKAGNAKACASDADASNPDDVKVGSSKAGSSKAGNSKAGSSKANSSEAEADNSEANSSEKEHIRILVSHGSKRAGSHQPTEAIAHSLGATSAYWSLEPSLDQCLETLMGEKAEQKIASIAIIPYFLFAGKITDAIAETVQEYQQRFPQIQFQVMKPIGEQAAIASHIAEWLVRMKAYTAI